MDQNSTKKVVVVGELHQDLFYRTTAYQNLIDHLVNAIDHKDFSSTPATELSKIITKVIDDCDKKIPGEAYVKRGGNGNNSAELLAKLQIPTQLMTTVGLGVDWMYSDLQKLGIGTETVFRVNYPTPISTIIEDPVITKIFIAPNLKAKMNFEEVHIENKQFDNTFIVFFTPMADKYVSVFNQIQTLPVLSAFTLELQKIDRLELLTQYIQHRSDFMFMNLNDAAKVAGFDTTMNDEKSIQQRLLDTDKIMIKFAAVRIYTLGKYGSWICDEDSPMQNIPIFSVVVKNRTGAGDTFAAGFLAALWSNLNAADEFRKLSKELRKKILKQCAIYASGAAALKISTGMAPTKDEINTFLNRNNIID
jgi:sugar/nucleoside kinase (ribokinase family)